MTPDPKSREAQMCGHCGGPHETNPQHYLANDCIRYFGVALKKAQEEIAGLRTRVRDDRLDFLEWRDRVAALEKINADCAEDVRETMLNAIDHYQRNRCHHPIRDTKCGRLAGHEGPHEITSGSPAPPSPEPSEERCAYPGCPDRTRDSRTVHCEDIPTSLHIKHDPVRWSHAFVPPAKEKPATETRCDCGHWCSWHINRERFTCSKAGCDCRGFKPAPEQRSVPTPQGESVSFSSHNEKPATETTKEETRIPHLAAQPGSPDSSR